VFEGGTRIRSRDEKSLLRRCFLHESRVVVDEISRRVCDLVEHNVVDKEVVTSELLAALEATTDGTKGRFLVRGIYDICVSNNNINGSGTFATAKGGEDGDDDSTYMPLYRAMKSGGAHVCSTFLYYATLKEKDIERFQRLFYRTILERNVNGAMASTSSSLLPGLARVALVRDGSFAALEILTKCLPWYKCSSAEDVSWVSEAIADIADWCEMIINDNNKKPEEEDRINAIVERAELGAMAHLCDAVKASLTHETSSTLEHLYHGKHFVNISSAAKDPSLTSATRANPGSNDEDVDAIAPLTFLSKIVR
jgi:hypothetical protein